MTGDAGDDDDDTSMIRASLPDDGILPGLKATKVMEMVGAVTCSSGSILSISCRVAWGYLPEVASL